jgi:hypothetical protein
MLVGALPAQRIGWRHSVRDRRAVRRSKIRRLAYRLGLAENQCTGNLPVASDFLVPIVDNHCLGKRPFVAVARKAEAVTQISGSFGFLFLGLVGFSTAEVVLEKGFLLKDRHKVRLAMNRL